MFTFITWNFGIFDFNENRRCMLNFLHLRFQVCTLRLLIYTFAELTFHAQPHKCISFQWSFAFILVIFAILCEILGSDKFYHLLFFFTYIQFLCYLVSNEYCHILIPLNNYSATCMKCTFRHKELSILSTLRNCWWEECKKNTFILWLNEWRIKRRMIKIVVQNDCVHVSLQHIYIHMLWQDEQAHFWYGCCTVAKIQRGRIDKRRAMCDYDSNRMEIVVGKSRANKKTLHLRKQCQSSRNSYKSINVP